MNISQLISSLLILVSCFSVNAEIVECAVDSTSKKIRPVFMNGMFNEYLDAELSARKMQERLEVLYGKENVEEVYIAYNDSEFTPSQIGEVVVHYLFDVMFSDTYDKDPSLLESSLLAMKNLASSLDVDARGHKTAIEEFVNNGELLMITSHSQGNIYFNLLYDRYLSNHLNSFRLVSVGSPVTVNAPKTHATMIVEKSDGIKVFNGLGNFHDSGASNSDNLEPFEGHSFINYINGSDTGKVMTNAYLDYYFKVFNASTNQLSINVESDISEVEFLVLEQFTEDHPVNNNLNASSINFFSTFSDSKFKDVLYSNYYTAGEMTKDGNSFSYKLDCNFILNYDESYISVKAWNPSNMGSNIESTYNGIHQNYSEDFLNQGEYNSEDYLDIGYELFIEKIDKRTIDVNYTKVNPVSKPIKVNIRNSNLTFDIFIRGYLVNINNDKDRPEVCISNVNVCEYDKSVKVKLGEISKTENGYEYLLDEIEIPDGYVIDSLYFYSLYPEELYPQYFTVNLSTNDYDMKNIYRLGRSVGFGLYNPDDETYHRPLSIFWLGNREGKVYSTNL